MITIRRIIPEDAAALSTFITLLDQESEFLLYDPQERQRSEISLQQFLVQLNEDARDQLIIAETQEQSIVGFIHGQISGLKRKSHIIKVNVGILSAYYGSGLGTQLAGALEIAIKDFGLRRMEASVISSNERSLKLCHKFGLQIEGIQKQAIKIGKNFYDEYMLAKFYY